jgi:hypothetical protein
VVNRPQGGLSRPVLIVFIVLQAIILWGVFALTHSSWAQFLALLVGSEVWHTLGIRAGKTRPLPRRADFPQVTFARQLEFISLMLVLGGAAIGLHLITKELGPWFWLYVGFVAPLLILMNSETFIERYGGSSSQPSA